MVELNKCFLDEKMKETINVCKKKFCYEFNLLYEYNELLYKVLYSLNGIDATDVNKYICSAFSELLKTYQASVIMLEYGLDTSFESLFRNILELSLKMIYVLNDDTNYERLEKKMCYDELVKMNYIKENGFYDIIPEDKINQYINYFEKRKNELSSKKVKSLPNIKDLCEKLDLKREYVYYGFLSDYTHKDLPAFYESITRKENYLVVSPNYSEITNKCLRLISSLQNLIPLIMKKYNIKLDEENNKIMEKAEELYNNLK